MSEKITHIFKKYFFIILLLSIEVVLFLMNYKPGTFLVGWDNLYPELNFKGNLKMNLFSIWQEYRGLGVEDGLAHSANLFHTLFLYLLSLFLPTNLLRYFFHILMHLMGGVGMYLILKKIFHKKSVLAFTGAIFYQYNLATIQTFYAPLEAFSIHFAALPWCFLSIIMMLEKPSRKRALFLFLVNILTTPQNFVPTIFITYLTGVFSILIIEFVKNGFTSLKRIILISFIIVCTNIFWLLPYFHAVKYQGPIIKNTKINQISSEEIFEKNKKRGTLQDLLLLRGLMLDIKENNPQGKIFPIMQQWNNHIQNQLIIFLSLIFSLFFIFGLIRLISTAIKKQGFDKAIYFLPFFVICFFMLGTRVVFISNLNTLLRTISPLFEEAFRFPFTKFFIGFGFCYTILLIYGLEFILDLLKQLPSKVSFVFVVLIFVYALPAFQGGFFYPALRQKIPPEYFQAIEYFKKEDKAKRIMTLPQTSLWNWLFYRFGVRGSGFLWYGIEQATLERPFDPWSNYNEQYFNEIFYALQTENSVLFKNVIDKYDVSYVLVDGYLTHQSKIQLPEKLASYIEKIYPQANKSVFGHILIYKLPPKDYIYLKQNLASIGSSFNYEFIDHFFEENGDYYYDKNWQVFYLFPSLFTNKTQADLEFNFDQEDNKIILSPKNKLQFPDQPDQKENYYLIIESFAKSEFYLPAQIKIVENELFISPAVIDLRIGDQEISIAVAPEGKITLPQQNIKKIVLNNEELNLDKSNFILLYINLPNSIEIFSENGLSSTSEFIPSITKDQQKIPLRFNSINKLPIQVSIDLIQPLNLLKYSSLEEGMYQVNVPCAEETNAGLAEFNKDEMIMKSKFSTTCFHKYLDGLKQQTGVALFLNTENINGLPLRVYIDNPYQKVNFSETKLDGDSQNKLLIIPPTSKYLYTDYGFHLRNVSPGSELTTNKLNSIQVSYLPYSWLRSLKIVKEANQYLNKKISTLSVNFSHKYQFIYRVEPNNLSPENSTLVLSQSFSSGWHAYQIKCQNSYLKCQIFPYLPFLFGQEIKNHVLVNNWANGWRINNSTTSNVAGAMKQFNNVAIVIIFLPQYLEFLGFFMTISALIFVLRFNKIRNI